MSDIGLVSGERATNQRMDVACFLVGQPLAKGRQLLVCLDRDAVPLGVSAQGCQQPLRAGANLGSRGVHPG